MEICDDKRHDTIVHQGKYGCPACGKIDELESEILELKDKLLESRY